MTYAVQEEPAFIKRFKEKIGYKEDPGIDAKVMVYSNYDIGRSGRSSPHSDV